MPHYYNYNTPQAWTTSTTSAWYDENTRNRTFRQHSDCFCQLPPNELDQKHESYIMVNISWDIFLAYSPSSVSSSSSSFVAVAPEATEFISSVSYWRPQMSTYAEVRDTCRRRFSVQTRAGFFGDAHLPLVASSRRGQRRSREYSPVAFESRRTVLRRRTHARTPYPYSNKGRYLTDWDDSTASTHERIYGGACGHSIRILCFGSISPFAWVFSRGKPRCPGCRARTCLTTWLTLSLTISYVISSSPEPLSEHRRNIWKADFQQMRLYLSEFDNDDVLNGDIDCAWEAFRSIIDHVIIIYSPLKKTNHNIGPPWFNRILRGLVKLKKQLYRKLLATR